MIDLNRFQKLVASPRTGVGIVLFLLAGLLLMEAALAAVRTGTNITAAIPWGQIGAKAGADYKGDGLAVMPTESGARLRCIFQRLDGEATSEGLWLSSTVTNTASDRFRVMATEVGRKAANALPLPEAGEVSVHGQTVRFSRPGLREEYSVSMDGVRQDFIVEEALPGPPGGELVVKLAVTGAQVEPAADGALLVLGDSGRKIAYGRLRVTDATGKELPARMEVSRVEDEFASFNSCDLKEELAVVVDDATAIYPVRIDPTFSDANWVGIGGIPAVNGDVEAAVIDGSGNLYVGGMFTAAGNANAYSIAQWNGSSWSALGSGIQGRSLNGRGPHVAALAISGSMLYAGGDFTMAGGGAAANVAQWNGSNWSALGAGVNNSVVALAVSSSAVYVGGGFTAAGGSAAASIAQWNGSNWSALGAGVPSYVNALAVSGSTLYAGGQFSTAGGISANSIAQWNGSSWSPLGSGLGAESVVEALAVSGTTLYASGYFDTIDSSYPSTASIAQWDGTNWSTLGSGVSSADPYNSYAEVYALAVSGSTVYAGGNFTTADGTEARFIAQWNGSNWSALSSGMGGDEPYVQALAVSGHTLYAGGNFTTAGGTNANFIAQWNSNSWSPVGTGMSGFVEALAVSSSTLYAGGSFTTAGATPATNIAQWNGSSWSPLGSGMNNEVYALAVSGNTLYAGGGFTVAGGIPANCIAQWNGDTWSALGAGFSGAAGPYGSLYGPSVNALAVSGSILYAGGLFTQQGDTPDGYIARWNGSSWSSLGSGMNAPVLALAVSGSALYAGGEFSTAGGTDASGVAQWNGSNWSSLGAGLSRGAGGFVSVNALAVSGRNLYAGGFFLTAGSTPVTNIAQWNGSGWSSLGSGVNNGMNDYVLALAVLGDTLYAGGQFTNAGGTDVNYIAQWDGTNWSALGSGLNNYVYALTVSGNTLYAGGEFTTAGTNVAGYAAMANLAGPPVSLAILTNTVFGFTNGLFGFDVFGPTGSNVVIQASTDLRNWIPLQTNLVGNGLFYFSDVQIPTNPQRFYRAQLSP